jgi:hypothetical protein
MVMFVTALMMVMVTIVMIVVIMVVMVVTMVVMVVTMMVMVLVIVLVMVLVMMRVMGAGNWGVGYGTGDRGRGVARAGTDAPEPQVSVYWHTNILQMECKTKKLYFLNFVKYHTYEQNQNSLNQFWALFFCSQRVKQFKDGGGGIFQGARDFFDP